MIARRSLASVSDKHWFIAPLAITLAVAIVAAIAYDRRDPVEYGQGTIIPREARSGETVAVRWMVNWSRQCEATLSREIVGSDGVVRSYEKRHLRIPVTLGWQTSDTEFVLAKGLPAGSAQYRGVLRFTDCGVTSRVFPLSVGVPALEVTVAPSNR